MDTPFVILRVIHILAGVFWAGAVFLTVTFLMKAMADAGPAGGQVMEALIKRRFFDALPAVALVTVLSGIELFRKASSGFSAAWLGSPTGVGFSIGAVAGILALAMAGLVGRSATLQAVKLMGQAMSVSDEKEKGPLIAQAGQLRERGAGAIRMAAYLLLVSVLAMAVSRYL
jgi:uncharacterized membrane protein